MRPGELAILRYARRVGERVGHLTFVGISSERGDNGRALGIFSCDCGGSATYRMTILNNRSKTHCGCQTDHGTHRTHGMRNSREYSSWISMKRRCMNPDDKDFPRYGAIGITVCPEWIASFSEFYNHIGPRPVGTTLDRIDNRLGYVPGNVRWASLNQQQRNRSISRIWEIKGQSFETLAEAAAHFGVCEQTVWVWVNGKFDNRSQSFLKPRKDCHAHPKY